MSGGGGYVDKSGNVWHGADPFAGTALQSLYTFKDPLELMYYESARFKAMQNGGSGKLVTNRYGQLGFWEATWSEMQNGYKTGTFSQTLNELVATFTFVNLPGGNGGGTGEEGNSWVKYASTGLGAFGASWGAKEQLIELAAKSAPAINELKYVKGVKFVSKGLFGAQIAISGYQTYNAWSKSDGNWRTNDGNKWGVTGKAALDITMAGIAAFGGPVGWVVSGTYFIADAVGAFDSWSEPAQP